MPNNPDSRRSPPASPTPRPASSAPPPPKRHRPNPAPPSEVDQALAHARSKLALLVNRNQLRNPVLRQIRHVRTEVHAGLAADFVCGPTTCVLFLSLQYHKLHPSYVYDRVRALGRSFRLRVLLVLADVDDHRAALHELSRMALLSSLTIVCAASEREAARYLETWRSYDTKGAEGIQERVGNDYPARVNAALSSIRGVNKTDVSTLAFTFGSVKGVALASEEELRKCPGMGDRKVARLFSAFHQPFDKEVEWTGTPAMDETADDDT